jgi:L-ascorbate metabolism protein UlaG (beta-lactamase superfamily)
MQKGTLLFLCLCIVILVGFSFAWHPKSGPADTLLSPELEDLFSVKLQDKEVAFIYLGYSAFIMRVADVTILIDPASQLKTDEIEFLKTKGVDFVLYTHTHFDHYNQGKALDIFAAGEPYIAAGPEVANTLTGKIPEGKLILLTPGKPQKIDGVTLDAVRGSHIGPITLFQIQVGDVSIFHGGDSSYVDMKKYPSELAFLPTGDPSPTASPAKALQMAADLKPQIAVTMHGSDGQNQEFQKLMQAKMPKTKVMSPARRTLKRVIIK